MNDIIDARCGWAGSDELYIKYHDEEWGRPVTNDRTLFEFLVLESAQAGLSWITILRKREGYRTAFHHFDIQRVARMTSEDIDRLMQFGGIVIDDVARTVKADGVPVELTFKEYALLHLFLEHPEEVLARERIMKDVWDTDDLLESRTIDMHVRSLRQKLGAAGEAIRTVRKVGYKLSTEGSDD